MILAIPAMGENMLQMILGVVDTAFLGRLHWTAMTAAGMANQILFIFQAFFMAIVIGSSVLVANAYGQKDPRSVSITCWNGFYLAVFLGIIMTSFGFGAKGLMIFFPGATEDLVRLASQYLQIMLYGGIGMVLMLFLGGLLRGVGDTKTPMIVVGISNGINILLDYALIFGKMGFPEMGVEGAALATVLSRLFGTVVLLWVCFQTPKLQIRVPDTWKLSFRRMKGMLIIGLPTAIENLIFTIGMLVFTNILFIAGPIAYAAHRVGISIESLAFMPGWGVSVGITTLVGHYNGRGDLQSVGGIVRQGWKLAVYFQVAMGIFVFAFPKLLIGMFSNDPIILSEAELPIRIIGMIQFFLATDFAMTGALRGVGDTRTPMLVTILAIWGIRIPLGFVLVRFAGLGLLGAWIGMMVDMVVRSIIKTLVYLRGNWEKTASKTRLSSRDS
jgi:putative MATE family efflux protein